MEPVDTQPAASAAAPALVCLEEQIEVWRSWMKTNCKHRSVREAVRAVRRFIELTECNDIRTLTTPQIMEASSKLPGGKKSLANTMCSLRNFVQWAMNMELIQVDPIPRMRMRRVKADPSKRMAPFTLEESEAIIAAAERDEGSAKPRFRTMRSVYYRVLRETGGRRSEVAGVGAICWRHVHLSEDGELPRITFAPDVAKATASDVPLTPKIAEVLRRWRERCWAAGPDDLVFPSPPSYKVLNADMEAAGISKRCPATGRARAFHSFRRGFATAGAKRGVQPAVMARLMRHADPKMTMDVYTDLELTDKLHGVARIFSDENISASPAVKAGNAQEKAKEPVDAREKSRHTHAPPAPANDTKLDADPLRRRVVPSFEGSASFPPVRGGSSDQNAGDRNRTCRTQEREQDRLGELLDIFRRLVDIAERQ